MQSMMRFTGEDSKQPPISISAELIEKVGEPSPATSWPRSRRLWSGAARGSGSRPVGAPQLMPSDR
jgi:hypothetical protein